jgi:hypothetical protein
MSTILGFLPRNKIGLELEPGMFQLRTKWTGFLHEPLKFSYRPNKKKTGNRSVVYTHLYNCDVAAGEDVGEIHVP